MSLGQICAPLIIGDLNILEQTARAMEIALDFMEAKEGQGEFYPKTIPVISLTNFSLADTLRADKQEECARASFYYVEKGAQMAMAKKLRP